MCCVSVSLLSLCDRAGKQQHLFACAVCKSATGLNRLFFSSIYKCEHRHVSALEQENKALLCAWRHRRNSFCVCCASGESLSLLFMALLFRHRCSAVCVFHCSSGTRGYGSLFLHSRAHTHTHFLASKTNTQLHEGSRKRAQPPETQKHYANETGTAVPFFSLSLSFFQHQSPNFFHSFKEPPSRNS